MALVGPYKGLDQARRIVEDAMSNKIHPVSSFSFIILLVSLFYLYFFFFFDLNKGVQY